MTSKQRLLSMSTILLLSTLCSVVDDVQADSLTLGLGSKHIVYDHCDRTTYQCDYRFNEVNPGIGYNKRLRNGYEIGLGFYKNSHYTNSNYITVKKAYKYGGFMATIADGYPVYNILPLIGVYGSLPLTNAIKVDILVPYTGNMIQVVAAQLRIEL